MSGLGVQSHGPACVGAWTRPPQPLAARPVRGSDRGVGAALRQAGLGLRQGPARRRQPAAAAAAAGGGAAEEAATGVVIVDHGSRRAEANAMLLEFVGLYRQVTGRAVVEAAHMELAEPTVAQAVAACVAAGAARVVVAPYFLSRGRHIQEDIPALVAEAQRAHPGVALSVAEPIGLDPLMAQLIEQRVARAQGAGN